MSRERLAGQRKDLARALDAVRRIELGGLPVIVEDAKGRVWEIWDIDFEG